MAFRSAKEGIAVGGDYKNPIVGDDTIAVTLDGGQSWTAVGDASAGAKAARRFPDGLFEGVGFADATTVVVIGPSRAKHASGVTSFAADASYNLGFKWKSDASDAILGLHACSFVAGITDPIAQVGWAVGDNGLIAKWIWRG